MKISLIIYNFTGERGWEDLKKRDFHVRILGEGSSNNKTNFGCLWEGREGGQIQYNMTILCGRHKCMLPKKIDPHEFIEFFSNDNFQTSTSHENEKNYE